MCVDEKTKQNNFLSETRERKNINEESRGTQKKERSLLLVFASVFFFSRPPLGKLSLAFVCVVAESPLVQIETNAGVSRSFVRAASSRSREERKRESFLTSKRSVGEKNFLFAIFPACVRPLAELVFSLCVYIKHPFIR